MIHGKGGTVSALYYKERVTQGGLSMFGDPTPPDTTPYPERVPGTQAVPLVCRVPPILQTASRNRPPTREQVSVKCVYPSDGGIFGMGEQTHVVGESRPPKGAARPRSWRASLVGKRVHEVDKVDLLQQKKNHSFP
jgi:hypothetical protein